MPEQSDYFTYKHYLTDYRNEFVALYTYAVDPLPGEFFDDKFKNYPPIPYLRQSNHVAYPDVCTSGIEEMDGWVDVLNNDRENITAEDFVNIYNKIDAIIINLCKL